MKKISFIIVILSIFSTTIFAQNNAIDKLFESYADNEDFTSVYISGKMFSTIAKSNSDEETGDILSNLKGLNILTTETNTMSFYKVAKDKLYNNGYDELMRVKDKGSNVLFFVRESNGKSAKELILLVGKNDKAVLMSFSGKIDLDKISQLGKTIHIDGAENLDKLDK